MVGGVIRLSFLSNSNSQKWWVGRVGVVGWVVVGWGCVGVGMLGWLGVRVVGWGGGVDGEGVGWVVVGVEGWLVV